MQFRPVVSAICLKTQTHMVTINCKIFLLIIISTALTRHEHGETMLFLAVCCLEKGKKSTLPLSQFYTK